MKDESGYINRQIGNYRVTNELASGAFGRIYLAQHTLLTKRTVAIKLLHAMHLDSARDRESFLQEAEFLEQLKHPYILPILDVGIDEGFPYLVAEYEPNGSLRDRIKKHAPQLLPLREILTIIKQVGVALQYAHEQNIIHRDLKPENILFNARNEAMLADFGLATSLSTASIKHVDNAGTPRYMAPEQFRENVSKESDQYSLACIVYELVTGRQPFTAKDFYTIGFKHLTENPVSPRQLNPSLPIATEQVILKAMSKQRSDRYRDVASFISALLTSASSEPCALASASTKQATSPQKASPTEPKLRTPTHPQTSYGSNPRISALSTVESEKDTRLLPMNGSDETATPGKGDPVTPLPGSFTGSHNDEGKNHSHPSMLISQLSTDGVKHAAHAFDPVTPSPFTDVEPLIISGENLNSLPGTVIEDVSTLNPIEFSQPPLSRMESTSTVVVDKPAITTVAAAREMPFPAADSWPVSDLSPDRKRGGTVPRWLVLAVVCLVVVSVLGVLLLLMPFMHSAHFSSNTPAQAVGTMPPARTPGTTLTRGRHTTPTLKPTHKPNIPGATPQSTGQAILLTPTSMHGTPSPTLQPTSPSSGGPGHPTPTSPPAPTPTSQPPTPTPSPTPLPSETLTVDFANANGAQTNYSYSGTVTITVSGTGQASSTAYSDAFYVYTDNAGNPLNPPKHESCWTMYINGVSTDHFVSTPSYSADHSYTFTMPAPGGTLNFSVCDGNHSDNTGSLTVTVAQD